MNTIRPLTSLTALPDHLRGTPIELLVAYHNLDRPFDIYQQAKLLIGMCMDNRKHMHIPDNFAFIIRTGGANLRYSEFKVSFAVGVGGVQHIALIGHTQCGMVNLQSKKTEFIEGLVSNAGWTRQEAEEHFTTFAPTFEIGNETDFVASEAERLNARYPNVIVAPFLYRVEDNLLYLIEH